MTVHTRMSVPSPHKLPTAVGTSHCCARSARHPYHRQTAGASAGLPTYVFPASNVIPFAPCAIGARTDPFFIVERPMRADRSPSTHSSPMTMGCDRQEHAHSAREQGGWEQIHHWCSTILLPFAHVHLGKCCSPQRRSLPSHGCG